MNQPFSLVGRGGLEPPTNGLKGRYARPAKSGYPLCAMRFDRLKQRFSPAFRKNSPTSEAQLRREIFSLLSAARP